ncbi:glutathione S-transferase [Vibrio hannami]|uniref:glutathione S-transferase n=1 Tax=Vibrio hannami TaxID=2717094 RepID=UPI00240F8AC1|nr:glutathione S-transferase [Vibrio hannami]MDG3088445.1 glutathione S-transferase [Vibrio hannami]
MTSTPILYSLHNCPYAIRARIALIRANQQVRIRSIKLDNKPIEMLYASPKGSVPVLIVETPGSDKPMVIEESLEIMVWALSQSDPHGLLCVNDQNALPEIIHLIADFEHHFIPALNAYSCAKRYHEDNLVECRQACEIQLKHLEERLGKHAFLFSEQESLLDIALMPFLRKFARIEKQWFRQSPYPKLRAWLNRYLQSYLFSKVMENHELWRENQADLFFGPFTKK